MVPPLNTPSLLRPNSLPRCRFPLFPRSALFQPGPRLRRLSLDLLYLVLAPRACT